MNGGELAGRLGERVTLSRPAPTRDALGGWTGGWVTVAGVWAEVAPIEGAPDAVPRFRVTMRPRTLLVGDRIAWGAETLIVRRVTADPAFPDRLVALAEQLP